MGRPYVQVTSENRVESLRQQMAVVVSRIEALPGVAGITLNGGLSRGYGDHLSEIDITVYLTDEALAAWQIGRSPIADGITVVDGSLYDVKVAGMAAEMARPWKGVELWDLSYAEILYDPEGAVAQLLQAKLAKWPQPVDAGGPLFDCWWHYRLAGDIWVHRGDALQGHHVLNGAVKPLIEALFLANGEFVPHEKWLVHMSRSLSWQPANWLARLARAMSTGDMSIGSLVERQAVLAGLWDHLDAYARSVAAPGLLVRLMQKPFYDLLAWLARAGNVSLAEWQTRARRGLWNKDPFHPLIRIEGDRVVLDRERLLAMRPEEMYAWHYEVLAAVRDQL